MSMNFRYRITVWQKSSEEITARKYKYKQINNAILKPRGIK